VQQALSAAFAAIGSGALAALRNVLDWAMGIHTSSFNFISLTPPGGTYQSTSVVTLWRWALGVMDAALALIAMWGGYNAMVRHQLGVRYHSALEFLPRLALAALAANLSLLFASFFIDLNNALCDGIGVVGLPGYGQFGQFGSLGQDLALLLLALIYGVVGLLLVLQMLLRLALLDLLIVLAPLGLLCWALPQTQAWARLWTSTFVATTLVQFLQMATLKLGAALILELTPGRLDNAVLTLLVGIAALTLTFKIPGTLRTWALRSMGAASVGGLVDYGVSMARAAVSVASAFA
jgi:Conjugal transfer protein TrbL